MTRGEHIKLLVGIIADTHDNMPMIKKAVETLNERNVDLVLHAGDYVAPFVIPKLNELKTKLIGVFGNNDGDRLLLRKRFSQYEMLDIRGNFTAFLIDGIKTALLHGDEEELLKALINSESFGVIVHGHTHKTEITRKKETLIINPGEVCGYLTGKSTLALLDTCELEAEVVEL